MDFPTQWSLPDRAAAPAPRARFEHLRRLFAPSKRGLRILFSRKGDWEPLLQNAFRDTPHCIGFDAFTADSIAAHDLIVPLTIADLKFLCGGRRQVRSVLPLPSLRSIELCDDKLLFNRALVEAGFGMYVPRTSERPFYPYIVKRRIDECGAHSHIVGSWVQEQALAGQCDGPEYFRQELIPGSHEYTTHIVFDRGRIRYALTIENVFASEIYIKGRERCVHFAQAPNPDCMRVFAAILRALRFRGLCCVNYKLVNGCPLIFEINPRFGYSLCPHFPHLLDCMRPRLRDRLPRVLSLQPAGA